MSCPDWSDPFHRATDGVKAHWWGGGRWRQAGGVGRGSQCRSEENLANVRLERIQNCPANVSVGSWASLFAEVFISVQLSGKGDVLKDSIS